MSLKDTIRSSLLQARKGEGVTVEIDGNQVEIRSPTYADVQAIGARKDGIASTMEGLIRCCYVPGTNDRVFSPADMDAMMAAPAGTFSALTDALQVVIKSVEAAGKKAPTPESSSST